MNDPLSQLLRHADQQTLPPMLDAAALPARVRQSAKKQFERRVAGYVLVTIPILAWVLFLTTQHVHQSQPRLVQADTPPTEDLAVQIAYHQRVAALLEANHRLTFTNRQPTDAFLLHLQLERSKAALVLLNSAQNRLRSDPDDPHAVDRFRQTIALFPDTPAASIAQQQIRQLQDSKRQS